MTVRQLFDVVVWVRYEWAFDDWKILGVYADPEMVVSGNNKWKKESEDSYSLDSEPFMGEALQKFRVQFPVMREIPAVNLGDFRQCLPT